MHINANNSAQIRPYIQLFAHYISDDIPLEDKFSCFMKMFTDTKTRLLNNPDLYFCKSAKDMQYACEQGKIAAFLSVEGGGFFDNDMRNNLKVTEFLANEGITFFSLCYNNGNNLCGGAFCDEDMGLSELGRSIVSMLASHNIVIDISHTNHKSANEILNLCSCKVVATHSNCYALAPHRRNLKDEQIKELISRGGLMGINLYPQFLNEQAVAGIRDVVEHIKYVLSLGGEDILCFGADFDGVEMLPQGICGVCDMPRVYEALCDSGINQKVIQKIFYDNVRNFILKQADEIIC